MEINTLSMSVIIIIYIGILSILAFYGYKETKTADDYMLAGRNIRAWIMSLSYGAAFISTAAIVGFGGTAAQFGFSLLWLTFLTIFVGVIVAFAFLGTRIRSMSQHFEANTFSTFLGKRYDSRFITVFVGAMIFIFLPIYTGAILKGGAYFIEVALNMEHNLALFILAIIVAAYVLSGGLRAVMYTDAFNGCIMLVGMIILLFSTYAAVGGFVDGHQTLTDMANLVPNDMVEIGHRGWTAMPEAGSQIWWTVISSLVMGVGIGVLAQPQLTMRFMTVKKTSSLYRAIAIGCVFIFFMTGTAFIVGPLSNVYFQETQGMLAMQVAEGNVDQIIPLFIDHFMPSWFLYLFMLTLLSAAISTTSSLIHVQGASFGKDILETSGIIKGEKNANGANNSNGTLPTRVGVLIGVVLAVMLAFLLPENVIARATAFWFGICAAGFLPALVGGLYWQGATRAGAIASMISGYAISIFGFLFLHVSESAEIGLAQLLFGKDALLEFPWTHINPLIYALPLSALVYVVVSLFTKPPATQAITHYFQRRG